MFRGSLQKQDVAESSRSPGRDEVCHSTTNSNPNTNGSSFLHLGFRGLGPLGQPQSKYLPGGAGGFAGFASSLGGHGRSLAMDKAGEQRLRCSSVENASLSEDDDDEELDDDDDDDDMVSDVDEIIDVVSGDDEVRRHHHRRQSSQGTDTSQRLETGENSHIV